jgi:4-amino-4-deoxy-L-arabinose transferase-like glycosyltransferase
MKFPPHIIFALTAVAALLSLGGVALWALAKSSRLLPLPKWIVGSIVVAVVAAASAWLVFILPVYSD